MNFAMETPQVEIVTSLLSITPVIFLSHLDLSNSHMTHGLCLLKVSFKDKLQAPSSNPAPIFTGGFSPISIPTDERENCMSNLYDNYKLTSTCVFTNFLTHHSMCCCVACPCVVCRVSFLAFPQYATTPRKAHNHQ